MARSTRRTGKRSSKTGAALRQPPDPRTASSPPRRDALRRAAARIRRMTRRPMKDEEYAWIGAILAECRAHGRDRYLEFVRCAELDAGRIRACNEVYSRTADVNITGKRENV